MNVPFTRRRLALYTVCFAVLGVCLATVVSVFGKSGARSVSVESTPVATGATADQPTPAPAAVTAEEQAKADLEQLVRDYYAAENAVFLNPMSDPSAALDPYLRNPASAARIADILSFRNAGHTFDTRTAEVHSVVVTGLDLATDPNTATIEECGTLSGKGQDGESGQPAAYTTRGLTLWVAHGLADGTWRLVTYDNPEDRSC